VTSKTKNKRQQATPTPNETTDENALPPYLFKVALQPRYNLGKLKRKKK
jgi:hypothetical protein